MDSGRLFQINVSKGGVPKLPVGSAEVARHGVVGDGQNDREHHGGAERAVCLYSLERILRLQEEGHPVFPGSTGENLTLAGIEDWSALEPGVRLRVGRAVVLEVASYTLPCSTIEASFTDGRIDRMSHKTHPGWSRVYARVLSPGEVRIGDAVVLTETDVS